MADITLHIYSPEMTLADCRVDKVELPGICGRFTVLKDHAALITSLTSGVLLFGADGRQQEVKIASGFVEVLDNHVTACVEL